MKAWGLMLMLVAVQAAGAPGYRAHMTGEQLIRDVMADPDEGLNSFHRARAMGYIDGVADGAAGTVWCPAAKPVPHELPYVVVEDISKMPKIQIAGDAAPLVLAALSKMYPCRPSGAP